ncbi:apolipoprotein D-like [Coccinella septempunctata]|uniref:apolipoprotein D-like n=1 Tax=Coccinella septempunctata TaxID=41139 RepID=UPI001D0600C2|nr:apolipoprotein D-like [Coccinella septempunctata]
MFKLVLWNFLLLGFLLKNVYCESYNLGGCPKMKSYESFNMTKFLGLWYIVEANDISISCATINIKANNSSKFNIEQSHNYRFLPFIQHLVVRTGRMRIIDEDNPAGMKIQWHWSYPSEYMVVFDTDYRNYAGVFFCSLMGIASESKIYILSRTTGLSDLHRNKVKESLKLNDFSASSLSKIEHKDCPTEKTENTFKLKVEPDFLSPKYIGNKIDKELKKNFDRKDCSREDSEEQVTMRG